MGYVGEYQREFESLGFLSACYYCGQVAETVDHVPPKTLRDRMTSEGIAFKAVEVAACKECNSALGPRPLLTLPARKDFVKAWIRRRYRRYLAIAHWPDDDLAELGPNLSGYVRASIVKRAIIKDRLAW